MIDNKNTWNGLNKTTNEINDMSYIIYFIEEQERILQLPSMKEKSRI